MAFLQNLLYGILVAIAPVITTFICQWLFTLIKEIKLKINNEQFNETINVVEQTIANAVTTTTQTYVDNLKKENLFNKEAQLVAFEKTKTAVLAQLTEDSKKVITTVYGDLNTYLTNMIETKVHEQK